MSEKIFKIVCTYEQMTLRLPRNTPSRRVLVIANIPPGARDDKSVSVHISDLIRVDVFCVNADIVASTPLGDTAAAYNISPLLTKAVT